VNVQETAEVFRPGKRKWSLVLLGSLGFVAIGSWMIRSGSSSDRFFGYAGLAFFGLCALVALLQFIPNASFLRISPDGLILCVMWRTTLYRWADIEGFGVADFSSFGQRHRYVGFNFRAGYSGPSPGRKARNYNQRLSGFEALLPENYGWDYSDLAQHLNQSRERYIRSGERLSV
jgi:hypothetical protein